MKSLFTTLYAAAVLLTSTATAVPAPASQTAEAAAPMCTRAKTNPYRVLTFDDLGDSQGKPAPINSTGYGNYKGMRFYEGSQRFVTEGNVSTVPMLGQYAPIVEATSHSHKNAIMGNYWNYQWNVGSSFEVASYPNPFNYFDLKSFWVRSQFRRNFKFSLSCAVANPLERKRNFINATWSVPAMPDGSFHKITPTPRQNFTHIWRCYYGAHSDELVLLDDIALCLGNTANKGDH